MLAIPLATVLGGKANYEVWQELHSMVLVSGHYDLKKAEWTHLAALTVLGLMALGTATVYALRRWGGIFGKQSSGIGARNAVPWLCGFIPIGTIVVGAALYMDVIVGQTVPSADVLEIYRISALRVIWFLPWLLNPLVIVIDVIGDVIFFALEANKRLSIGSDVERRFLTAIRYARTQTRSDIVVLSHSLGTVISAQFLCALGQDGIKLITTGSPISSLHGRFLNWHLKDLPDFKKYPDHWVNIYRDGDYIGGPIERIESVVQYCHHGGGHVGYWDDDDVFRAVQRALE
ncbi:MAG: hypothetical protein HY735_11810 [Verrucomicrobia bacterium]|nr:hypothetical protein [Verrucomicrobiota bacterium]